MRRIATIGFFDGVHKGHQFLFTHLRALAQERGLAPLIVTFDTHPRAVLDADYIPQLLTSREEREKHLSQYGEVLMLPFADIQPLTAQEFMTRLRDEYGVSVLLMGYDHRFGSDRLKHPQDYRRVGEQCGVEVLTLNEYVENEWHVSSTEIRLALETIAKLEKITVADEKVEEEYKNISDAYNVPVEQVKNMVDAEDIRRDLAVKAAMDLVKEKAKIKAKKAAPAKKPAAKPAEKKADDAEKKPAAKTTKSTTTKAAAPKTTAPKTTAAKTTAAKTTTKAAAPKTAAAKKPAAKKTTDKE